MKTKFLAILGVLIISFSVNSNAFADCFREARDCNRNCVQTYTKTTQQLACSLTCTTEERACNRKEERERERERNNRYSAPSYDNSNSYNRYSAPSNSYRRPSQTHNATKPLLTPKPSIYKLHAIGMQKAIDCIIPERRDDGLFYVNKCGIQFSYSYCFYNTREGHWANSLNCDDNFKGANTIPAFGEEKISFTKGYSWGDIRHGVCASRVELNGKTHIHLNTLKKPGTTYVCKYTGSSGR